MIYTLAKLRAYARTCDNRLENTTSYPDSWIDERIEEGLALAQDIKQVVFSTTEKYDITNDLTVDMLDAVEIVLQREPHSVYTVEYEADYLMHEITPNNHVIIRRIPDLPLPTDYIITIRYFYYPTMPFTEIEMSMEVYKLCKATIAAVCYSMLKDQESEQYQLGMAENIAIRSTFDIEKDLMETPEGRLWSGSWT